MQNRKKYDAIQNELIRHEESILIARNALTSKKIETSNEDKKYKSFESSLN